MPWASAFVRQNGEQTRPVTRMQSGHIGFWQTRQRWVASWPGCLPQGWAGAAASAAAEADPAAPAWTATRKPGAGPGGGVVAGRAATTGPAGTDGAEGCVAT